MVRPQTKRWSEVSEAEAQHHGQHHVLENGRTDAILGQSSFGALEGSDGGLLDQKKPLKMSKPEPGVSLNIFFLFSDSFFSSHREQLLAALPSLQIWLAGGVTEL